MNKQSFITILLTVLMSMTGAKTFAHDIAVANADKVTIYYNWIKKKTELAVSYCGSDYSWVGAQRYSGNVVIPESVDYNGNTYPVTSIGSYAFYRSSGLTSVTIPNSVTSIGNQAFFNCSGLTSITIPSSVTSIGEAAFKNCSGLTSIVVETGNSYFDSRNNCNAIIETESNKLLFGCNNTTIPNSVTSIGNRAFYGCSGLTSVTIPNSVTSIEEAAFAYCSGLESVTIPNSVNSIDDKAFSGCSGLTSIVVETGNSYYDSQNNCNAIIETVNNKLLLGCKNTTIPNSVTSIGSYAFYGCSGLTSVTIPNSVTSIGVCAFYGCSGLTSVTIGSGVTSIGEYAFYDTNINIKKTFWLTNTPPNGYKEASGTINYVSNDQFSFENQVIYQFLSSYFEVDGIRYVPVSPSARTCDAIDCAYDESVANTKIASTIAYKGVSMNVKNIQPYFAYNNKFIKMLVIDNDGELSNYAFTNCSNMQSATLGQKVSTIGSYAFQNCSSLEAIEIPDIVTVLNDYAFEGCSSLKEVKLGSQLKIINQYAFGGCRSLPSVNIPKAVTSIGCNVFSGCRSLTKVILADSEATLKLGYNYYKYDDGDPIFSSCPLDYVYIGRDISYSTSSNCGYSPFYRNTSLRAVKITDKETEISENEFYGCTNLQQVEIGDGVTTIGNRAFSGCQSLKYFAFGSQVATIGQEAFSDCTAIEEIISKAQTPPTCGSQALDDINKWECKLYVPKGCMTVYNKANQWKDFFFKEEGEDTTPADDPTSGSCGETANYSYDKATHTLAISGKGEIYDYDNGSNKAPWSVYADEIQKIEIESGIISVGYYAFYKCSSLTSLSVPATLKYIGSSAFEDCTCLTSLSLNEGLLIIEGSAFKNCKGITDVYCNAERVPKTDKTAFDGTPIESATLHVPANSVEAYKASRPWSDFKNIVAIGSTPADDPTSGSCGETANYSYDKATHTLVISGKGEIYDYDNGSNKAPWTAYADEIQKIEIEPGIISVGYFAFYKCSSLTSLSVPATLKYIGSSAFEDCTSLTSLSLNEGLLIIEGSAFKNCKGITDVYCYAESVPKTNKTAFDGTPIKSATLYVPANSVEAYKASRPWSGFKEIVPLNGNPDGIIGNKQSDDVKTVYSIKGEKLLHPAKGVNIIKMKDGTIKKVFVK